MFNLTNKSEQSQQSTNYRKTQTYLWMICHHTMFTDIYTMFKTKLICDLPLRTLTEAHFNYSIFLTFQIYPELTHGLC
jgi:hypothetical protein